uniref:Secreted protein n=1 Tax=Ixodes ricinus TaxID=34613 RepID=A0A6B0UKD6_IXORI
MRGFLWPSLLDLTGAVLPRVGLPERSAGVDTVPPGRGGAGEALEPLRFASVPPALSSLRQKSSGGLWKVSFSQRMLEMGVPSRERYRSYTNSTFLGSSRVRKYTSTGMLKPA